MDTTMQVDDTLGTSFGERFIEDNLGQKMSSDPITAIVELIANSEPVGTSLAFCTIFSVQPRRRKTSCHNVDDKFFCKLTIC